MIKFFISLFIIFFVNSAMADIEPDKKMHLHVSAMAGYMSYTLLRAARKQKHRAAVYAFVTVMVLGAAKESFLDDRFDTGDMAYNALGAAGGIFVPFVIGF